MGIDAQREAAEQLPPAGPRAHEPRAATHAVDGAGEAGVNTPARSASLLPRLAVTKVPKGTLERAQWYFCQPDPGAGLKHASYLPHPPHGLPGQSPAPVTGPVVPTRAEPLSDSP
jgi:hypothetical protein